MPNTKLDNYFKTALMNLHEECNNHGNNDLPDCKYVSDFLIEHFCVESRHYILCNMTGNKNFINHLGCKK